MNRLPTLTTIRESRIRGRKLESERWKKGGKGHHQTILSDEGCGWTVREQA